MFCGFPTVGKFSALTVPLHCSLINDFAYLAIVVDLQIKLVNK